MQWLLVMLKHNEARVWENGHKIFSSHESLEREHGKTVVCKMGVLALLGFPAGYLKSANGRAENPANPVMTMPKIRQGTPKVLKPPFCIILKTTYKVALSLIVVLTYDCKKHITKTSHQTLYQVYSHNGYSFWEWRSHSDVAGTGFPFSNENKMCNGSHKE